MGVADDIVPGGIVGINHPKLSADGERLVRRAAPMLIPVEGTPGVHEGPGMAMSDNRGHEVSTF